MYLLILGVILLVMKWLAWGLVAQWSWWTVLTPFALTVAWWIWADRFGYTRRQAIRRERREAQKCRQRRMAVLGPRPRR